MKAQAVRLLDVWLLGPFMMWASRELRAPARMILWWAGLATIVYNGVHYARHAEDGHE